MRKPTDFLGLTTHSNRPDSTCSPPVFLDTTLDPMLAYALIFA